MEIMTSEDTLLGIVGLVLIVVAIVGLAHKMAKTQKKAIMC